MPKKRCTPCEMSAALIVGDRVCHTVGDMPCHALENEVRSGRMTIGRYLEKLEAKAREKGRKDEERKIRNIIKYMRGQTDEMP